MKFKVIKNFLVNTPLLYLSKSDIGLVLFLQLEEQLKAQPQHAVQVTRTFIDRHFGRKIYQVGIPSDYITLMARTICLRKAGENDADLYSELLNQTGQLSAHVLSTRRWLALEIIATASGLYRVGYIVRQIAVRRALELGSANLKWHQKSQQFTAFKAAIDQHDYLLAESIFSTHLSRQLNSNLREDAKLFLALLNVRASDSLSQFQLPQNPSEQAFATLIRGKRVAVVGPAPNDEDSADEIDHFDVVIRLNYRGPESLPPAAHYGQRIDLSYYNGDNAKSILKLQDFKFAKDLKFAVFKSAAFANHPFLKSAAQPVTRAMISPHPFWFYGTPTMIPNVLFDLIHFQPAEIKLFKANFFLTHQLYYKGYSTVDHSLSHFSKLWYNHAKHNLISQLNFTRLLLKNGLIQADETCRSVLDLDNQTYIDRMEQLFVTQPMQNAGQIDN